MPTFFNQMLFNSWYNCGLGTGAALLIVCKVGWVEALHYCTAGSHMVGLTWFPSLYLVPESNVPKKEIYYVLKNKTYAIAEK